MAQAKDDTQDKSQDQDEDEKARSKQVTGIQGRT